MPGAAALVARGGEDVEIGARRRARAGFDRPDRVDHEADHRCRGHAPRGRRARCARRPGRALAARAGARRRSCARRRARSTTSCRPTRPITVEDLLTFRAGWGFPSDFSLPAVARALREAPGLRAARDAGRVARDARAGADAPPARRGVALQHLLRHPGRPGRAGLGPAAAGLPRRAHLRAARDGRHGLPCPGGEARPAAAVSPRRGDAGRGQALDGAADLPLGGRRPRLDARRLASLRTDAARGGRGCSCPPTRCA